MTGENREQRSVDWLRTHVESVVGVPALVRDRHLTVLASNSLARALSPGFVEGVNLARFTFIDSAAHAGDECWHVASSQVAAMLRESLDNHAEDAPFRTIVGELSATSVPFSQQWADETTPARTGVARFLDTLVGDLTLAYDEQWIDDDQAEALLTLSAVDPQTEARLDELALLVEAGRPSE